jgi:hypothetical protein
VAQFADGLGLFLAHRVGLACSGTEKEQEKDKEKDVGKAERRRESVSYLTIKLRHPAAEELPVPQFVCMIYKFLQTQDRHPIHPHAGLLKRLSLCAGKERFVLQLYATARRNPVVSKRTTFEMSDQKYTIASNNQSRASDLMFHLSW